MELKDIREVAKEKMKAVCVLCRECDGVWCAGKVPGMGGIGTGEAFKYSAAQLKKRKLIMKTIHDVKEPQLETTLFGEKLSLPVIGAPITGAKSHMGGGVTEEEYSNDVINGAIAAGTISMIGDSADPADNAVGIKAIKEAGGKGILIIKPRENSEIIKRIREAEEAGAIAVGVDVDGAAHVQMKLNGQHVSSKTFSELKELVESTKLPFIVKGILSAEEAELCAKAGVAAVVVSNHGGRVLNETVAPIDVIEEIGVRVGDKVVVLADGSIREGVDVLKFLALGAKGVLLGRPMIWGSIGGREKGVEVMLNTLKNQLTQAMILTGVQDVNSVDKKIVAKV